MYSPYRFKTKNFALLLLLLFLNPVFSGNYEEKEKKAPDFTLDVINSTDSISLSKLRGTVVLLDFWATWCPPCKKSLPYLSKLEGKYKNLKVIAVNIDDDRESALNFIKENNLNLTAVYDADKTVVSAYDIPEMPTAYLIDQYGKIKYTHSGYTEESIKKLEFAIRGLVDSP